MWAILDYDNTTVIGCMPPDVDIESSEVKKEINNKTLIRMTADNSPAYVNGKYIDGKFYPPEGVTNG